MIPANVHEQLARSRKLLLLSTALDNAFRYGSIDPFSAVAAEHVEALTDEGWRTAAGHAGCNPPSEITKEELRSVYRHRAAASKALAFLRKPRCGGAMNATWTVTYETATLQAGTAPTMEEADRIAANVHDSYVIKGLNPDALAWHVDGKRAEKLQGCDGCGALVSEDDIHRVRDQHGADTSQCSRCLGMECDDDFDPDFDLGFGPLPEDGR